MGVGQCHFDKRSTDGGAKWDADVRMTNTLTHTRHPQIVATKQRRVCCIWEDGQSFDGKRWSGDPGLYAALSADNGQTWDAPRRITFVNAPHGWATHAKAFALGSRIHLAWTDAPDGTQESRAAYYMTSRDGGLTWGTPERLTSPSDGETWAQAVTGTESYAIVVVSRSDRLSYRRTLAGAYYDGDTLGNPKGWLESLDRTPGALGIMYTTWRNKYELLAPFGDLVSGKSPR